MPFPSPSAQRDAALAPALAQIGRAFGGREYGPGPGPRVAKHEAPVRCIRHRVPESVRADNLARMSAWVEIQFSFAETLSPAEARTFLLSRAEHVDGQLARLECGEPPPGLRGLDASEIATIRDRLAAAALAQAERVA